MLLVVDFENTNPSLFGHFWARTLRGNIVPGRAPGKFPTQVFEMVFREFPGIRPRPHVHDYHSSMVRALHPRSAGWIAIGIALACTATPSRETVEQELLESDRAFLQATVTDGLEGWLSFFTDDALRVDLHGQTAAGLDAIRIADAPLFEPGGLRLRWEPTEAVAFTGGEGGMTRGRYTLSRDTPAGDGGPDVVAEGTYLTLWRREDGRFKVYFDTGAPDPPLETLID